MTSVLDQVLAQRLEHATHVEWFLTAAPQTGTDIETDAEVDVEDVASKLFEALGELLKNERIEVLQEKIYGLRQAHASILQRRGAALSRIGIRAGWPVTVVEGGSASGAPFAGVQLWGVTLRPDSGQRVETAIWQGRAVGREWIGQDFRQLLLAGIDGAAPLQTLEATTQAQQMFEAASAMLSARGYSFRQVARTWIYLSQLLDWYADFNRVRNAHYSASGLAATGAAVFPASTGIQARRDREQCLMDVLAVDARAGSELSVRPVLHSARQGQAFSYGSAFARAMVIERSAGKIIHVSGTASIDGAGQSRHHGDAAAQYTETLLSIAAVLEQEGASIADIVQGTLFAKTPAINQTCREVARRLCLPALPLLEIIADVCRPELLVEIEAVAIVQRARS